MSLSKTISTTNARKTLLSQASFRDVGGVVTKDGAVVKHGQVYRSGLLRHLQASDHVALSNIGLKSLFDLRGPAEKATERHDWAGFAKVTQPLEQVETLAGTQPRIWAQRLQNPAYTPEMARASLLHTYQDMPTKLATAVGALAQSVMGEERIC